jgi:hypothetical protein
MMMDLRRRLTSMIDKEYATMSLDKLIGGRAEQEFSPAAVTERPNDEASMDITWTRVPRPKPGSKNV